MSAKPMDQVRKILKDISKQDPEHSLGKVFKAQWGRLGIVKILWKTLLPGGLFQNIKAIRQGRVGRVSAQLFLAMWETFGQREAIVAPPDRRLSYAQLRQRTLRLANALVGMGLRPKDRLGVMLYNQPEFIETEREDSWGLGPDSAFDTERG